ncbi:heavy metal transport/detoxification protein [Poseidonibacter ostreae]|uniref:Heavy metal transport/detoxification protein n=1 Tax=Poseidonibacter ostreae TaxID=2654171 RepID=A0A6L4WSN1_9BACT|nr:heavy metal transport/detoxification protein [Poseidonibacter ostreae]KAB7885014.1 heavy metal transport/detoxification protein [Poseidonibacter ostreae]KAB7889006.1 heavy metal transport/detoxification protein [Poseidonibacter ostreae]KAB7891939.1 heavy metal transport/detoxification protein [Poseidonibacter ostreae]
MTKNFKTNNISCINCANLIKASLEDKFGDIKINLETNPKEVIVEIKDNTQESEFKKEMSALGFQIIED